MKKPIVVNIDLEIEQPSKGRQYIVVEHMSYFGFFEALHNLYDVFLVSVLIHRSKQRRVIHERKECIQAFIELLQKQYSLKV